MAATKFCKRCGRDRFDPDEHEVVKIPTGGLLHVAKHETGTIRRRVCKNLTLVADSTARDLVTGETRVLKRYVPETPQRTKANRARWVHRDTLKAQDRQEALK